MEGQPRISITVYSDTICPWCYVAKRHLDIAIAHKPQYEIVIRWVPYILTNPHHPDPQPAYFKAIFGGDGAVADKIAALTEAGRDVGLQLRLTTLPFGIDTFQSHRLMNYAHRFGKQNELADVLFNLFLEQNVDISDLDILTRAGNSIGLPNVEGFLDSQDEVETVWLDDFTAKHSKQTQGVPFFVFNDTFGVSGVQSAHDFSNVLDEVAAHPTSTSHLQTQQPYVPQPLFDLPPNTPDFPLDLEGFSHPDRQSHNPKFTNKAELEKLYPRRQ